MKPNDLEKLLEDLESDLVERKESANDIKKINQAICAFANDLPHHGAPGYVFIGVDDAGNPVSLKITDQLLQNLAHLRSEGNIQPIPAMTVQKVLLKGAPVVVVEVHPSDIPPVRYKGQVWVRVGSRRATATPDEERRLAERHVAGSLTFDRRPCSEAGLSDLLLDNFRTQYLPNAVAAEVLAQNQRTALEQLASLRLFDAKRGVPTNAGLLVLGANPQSFLPCAYVQFVRYDGRTLADAVQSSNEVTGDLLTQLQQLDRLLPLQIHTARVPSQTLAHAEIPDYPLQAIREFVLNAILHRTYEATNAPVRINWFSDRVEVQNPGGLYGTVTPENFERTSDYRNPVLAEAMKTLGYVEKFGVGIARAKAALKANGSPEPVFAFEPSQVLVTVRRRA
ncbi:MAG: putative DNA binding domain-containing protein [Planctomycetes bacterium]|nr:putative DNA binding domain-containing protein [Planctomycetota bacterium]